MAEYLVQIILISSLFDHNNLKSATDGVLHIRKCTGRSDVKLIPLPGPGDDVLAFTT